MRGPSARAALGNVRRTMDTMLKMMKGIETRC